MKNKLTFFNGSFIPHNQLKVHIDDRGYIFGDGIYEVMAFEDSKYIDAKPHYDRFVRTCNTIGYEFGGILPKSYQDFIQICDSVINANKNLGILNGYLYIQVTRGNLGFRTHNAPNCKDELSFIIVINEAVKIQDWWLTKGLQCITCDDIRWQRRDIKSLQLLPNVMAKQKAIDQNCDDAIFIDNSIATEATSANLFIVKNGVVITHPKSNKILWGITRMRILHLCSEFKIPYLEEFSTREDLLNADEIFLSNSNSRVRPVTKIDGKIIGDGKVGKISTNLYNLYNDFAKSQ